MFFPFFLQWRYALITLGSAVCIAIFFWFPKPLLAFNLPLVAAIFLMAATLVAIGCVWDFIACLREKKNLIHSDFPAKRHFDYYSYALRFRALAIISSALVIFICSIDATIPNSIDGTTMALAKITAALSLLCFLNSFQCDYKSRQIS